MDLGAPILLTCSFWLILLQFQKWSNEFTTTFQADMKDIMSFGYATPMIRLAYQTIIPQKSGADAHLIAKAGWSYAKGN